MCQYFQQKNQNGASDFFVGNGICWKKKEIHILYMPHLKLRKKYIEMIFGPYKTLTFI